MVPYKSTANLRFFVLSLSLTYCYPSLGEIVLAEIHSRGSPRKDRSYRSVDILFFPLTFVGLFSCS